MIPVMPCFLHQAKEILGARCWSVDARMLAPHLEDWRGRIRGTTPLLAMPDSREKVSALLALCHDQRVSVTPQGGNTGLVGGGIPQGEILLSTRRLNALAVDAEDMSVIAGAGAVLASVQEAARQIDCLFPLSLGSEGSATIGGLIATNAGGVAVLRYGSMRQMVLGLEVVLPDGRIWNGLRTLHKDNTGVDLKQIYAGSEGTLGVITAAALRLFPMPAAQQVVWAAVADPSQAVSVLGRMRKAFGGALTAFELIPRRAVELVEKYIPTVSDPLGDIEARWRVLIELSFHAGAGDQCAQSEMVLADGQVDQAVLAGNERQRQALWRLRESIPDAEKRYSRSVKNDISLPVARVADFMDIAGARIEALYPTAEVIAFGHLGDGNLHYNIFPPARAVGNVEAVSAFFSSADELTRLVNDLVVEMGGSISAEHGIGSLKRDELARLCDGVELDMQRSLKAALDPRGILNPGRIVAS